MQRTEQALGERFFDNGARLVLPTDGTVTGRWRRLQALTDTQTPAPLQATYRAIWRV